MSKKYFDGVGLFCQLSACNVSVAASGSFVDATLANRFVAQKLSGEVLGGQNSCVKIFQNSCVKICS